MAQEIIMLKEHEHLYAKEGRDLFGGLCYATTSLDRQYGVDHFKRLSKRED